MQEFPQGADRAAGRFASPKPTGSARGGGAGRRRACGPVPAPLLSPAGRRLSPSGPAPRTLLPHRRKPLRSLFPRRHPALPAHPCRTAGLRPAGQTVLRTVLGGGLRPPPRRRPAPPALRAALPLQAPLHPHAKAPAVPAGASLCQYSSIGSPSGPAAIFLSVSSSISCRSAVR